MVEAVDLGRLTKVKVNHDGLGAGSGWFLDRVTVKESQSGTEKYLFNCERWEEDVRGCVSNGGHTLN